MKGNDAYMKEIITPLNAEGFLDVETVAKEFHQLMSQMQYKEALHYLNHMKNHGGFGHHKDIIKLHDLYIEILLEIEDYQSLLNILLSKEKYLESQKSQSMHQFYLAICYEGLEQPLKAIESLEKIEDNLSNRLMVNKYLKLALLNLQLGRKDETNKLLGHAYVFDRSKTNEMFYLVESDIAFYEKRYVDAMKLYEDFFIKTERKLSYIDRFMKISLAMDRVHDAFEIYHRYVNQINSEASIQVKKLFYQTALIFLKAIDINEYQVANLAYQSLITRDEIHFDDFNYFNLLLGQLKKHQLVDKKREMIRRVFIDLNHSHLYQKLVFLEVIDGAIQVYHLSKQMLLEKNQEINHYIYEDLLVGNQSSVYSKSEVKSLEFYLESTEFVFIEKVNEQSYMMAYVEQQSYDLAKKLIILTAHVLADKLYFDEIIHQKDHQLKSSYDLLNLAEIGFFKVAHQQLICLNQYGKGLLQLESSMIPFSDFQSMVEPMIYIDDLLSNTQISLMINGVEMIIYAIAIDLTVYVMIQRRLDDVKKTDHTWVEHKEHSVALLVVYNDHQLISKYGYEKYRILFTQLLKQLPKLTNHHLLDHRQEANHWIYLLLDNRDKRLTERLIFKIHQLLDDDFDIRLSYLMMNQDFDTLKSKLDHLIFFTSKANPFISSARIIDQEKEKNHQYLSHIKQMLDAKSLPIKSQKIIDWKKQTISLLLWAFDSPQHLSDMTRFNQILNDHQLDTSYNLLFVNQLIKEVVNLTKPTKILIPISTASIISKKAFNYLLKRLKLIVRHQIVFYLSFSDYRLLGQKDKQYLNDKQISICLKTSLIDLSQMNQIEDLDYCLIEPEVMNHEFSLAYAMMLKKKFHHIIYHHYDETVTRSSLETHDVTYLMGRYVQNES